MTNFDYLKANSKFDTFADVAISAEKILHIDIDSCVLNCRRAMEFAIKWMYSVDSSLEKPYQDNLLSLMSTDEFHNLIEINLWKRLDLIRKIGNRVNHNVKKVSRDEAIQCLENLFIFLDFIAYCYGDSYQEVKFDVSLLEKQESLENVKPLSEKELDLNDLIEENKNIKEEITARRKEQYETYVPKPINLSEYKTRKIYIDTMLIDAGWKEGKNWLNEVEILEMPNKSGVGYADYVLYDDSHKPLAVIEAKRTCVDVAQGRQQAKLYADYLEKKYHRRPVVFLTNGFETRIIDGCYPERNCAAIYSKSDLEKMFNLHALRQNLSYVSIDKKIAGRYYQEGAIKAACDSFDKKNRRKVLFVMATGSGKTRTIIALCKVLLDYGWVKNILFLADRNSLVTQAKRNFVNFLPDLSCSNLVEDKENYTAHCIFSTYNTMMNCIDSAKNENDEKLFTCGHFDLVICDEAHRSIYNKYNDIFNYFDAPLVGLTATPKDEIDKNTYEIFELENGVPTYGYELAQAVKDGFLVDFVSVETKLKFIEEGIVYDDLSEEEKEEYENNFARDGELPEKIESSALNDWVFNESTIKEVLNILMTNGIKIDYGQKIGKTIIFAKNHLHAEAIFKVFNKNYPHLADYAKVIDNKIKYSQDAIDEFSEADKLPQIAISVDMLDTGVDVPEVLNLVFFKKVMSKAKFWQMIGRGTRTCEGLLDGEDKNKFYIFDFCGNFEFFRMSKGKASAATMSLPEAIFNLEFQMAYKLQDLQYQEEELIEYRKNLVNVMVEKVQELDRNNFSIRQHIKYVDTYSVKENYQALTYESTLNVKEELAPYILPDNDDVSALRFDALLFGLELACLVQKKYGKAKKDLLRIVRNISSTANIPEIQVQSELINKILHTDFVDKAGIADFETIRENLRNLVKYIVNERKIYETNFEEDILSMEYHEADLESEELNNYKAKAEYYVRKNQDHPVIAKLKTNIPLTANDVLSLENILWGELGSKREYEAEYGTKPLGEFVREIVGLDMNAAKTAFSKFLDNANLDSRQIYFINQIVEYIVQNGMMKDFSVLQDSPFTDKGSVVDVFSDDLNLWLEIKSVIEKINANAAA